MYVISETYRRVLNEGTNALNSGGNIIRKRPRTIHRSYINV